MRGNKRIDLLHIHLGRSLNSIPDHRETNIGGLRVAFSRFCIRHLLRAKPRDPHCGRKPVPFIAGLTRNPYTIITRDPHCGLDPQSLNPIDYAFAGTQMTTMPAADEAVC